MKDSSGGNGNVHKGILKGGPSGYSVTMEEYRNSGIYVTIGCLPTEYILDEAEDEGIDFIISSCRVGCCSTCAAICISGSYDDEDQSFRDDDQRAARYFLPCVTYPESNIEMICNVEDEL